MYVPMPLQTLTEQTKRGELEESVAEKAADIARHAEAQGQHREAQVFWKLEHRCRVIAMMLRVKDALSAPALGLLN
jgi:hypothetical protein